MRKLALLAVLAGTLGFAGHASAQTYYQQAPVYVQPPVTYAAPTYYAQQPTVVYAQPQVVYSQPVYAPPVYYTEPVYYQRPYYGPDLSLGFFFGGHGRGWR
jgi:hypothetical protein